MLLSFFFVFKFGELFLYLKCGVAPQEGSSSVSVCFPFLEYLLPTEETSPVQHQSEKNEMHRMKSLKEDSVVCCYNTLFLIHKVYFFMQCLFKLQGHCVQECLRC